MEGQINAGVTIKVEEVQKIVGTKEVKMGPRVL